MHLKHLLLSFVEVAVWNRLKRYSRALVHVDVLGLGFRAVPTCSGDAT